MYFIKNLTLYSFHFRGEQGAPGPMGESGSPGAVGEKQNKIIFNFY